MFVAAIQVPFGLNNQLDGAIDFVRWKAIHPLNQRNINM